MLMRWFRQAWHIPTATLVTHPKNYMLHQETRRMRMVYQNRRILLCSEVFRARPLHIFWVLVHHGCGFFLHLPCRFIIAHQYTSIHPVSEIWNSQTTSIAFPSCETHHNTESSGRTTSYYPSLGRVRAIFVCSRVFFQKRSTSANPIPMIWSFW